MTCTILAVRHARTIAGDGPVGRRDVALAGRAEAAARAVLEVVAAQPIDAVWSSPLSRCADTARLVAGALGRPHHVDPRLLEIDYGAWEGRPWAEIERDEPAAWAAWLAGWQTVGPPGGESAAAVEARVRAWLDERRGRLLLVGHAGVLRALRVICDGLAWPDAMAQPVPHAGEPGALHTYRVA